MGRGSCGDRCCSAASALQCVWPAGLSCDATAVTSGCWLYYFDLEGYYQAVGWLGWLWLAFRPRSDEWCQTSLCSAGAGQVAGALCALLPHFDSASTDCLLVCVGALQLAPLVPCCSAIGVYYQTGWWRPSSTSVTTTSLWWGAVLSSPA